MRCERCDGKGTIEVNMVRFIHEVPCPECNGCGYTQCCEGTCEQPEPEDRMRNLVAHPVTREEIVGCLRQLSSQLGDEMLIGDMRPLLLRIAAQVVAKERDNKAVYRVSDLTAEEDGRSVG